MDNKNDAPAIPRQNAPNITITANTIPQPGAAIQPPVPPPPSKKGKRERHTLGIDSKVYALAIKCYDEQLPHGRDYTFNAIRQIDKSQYQIIAIIHDRDTVTAGIWAEATVKPHLHVIIRCVDRKKRIRVSTFLNWLGIYFRPNFDDALWREHGVETIGNYTGYTMYLTHETKEAIDDAKELYSVDELISNLTKDEIIHIREGYIRVSANAHKVTSDELAALDQDAYNLGYEMKNFAQWYDAQPFTVRSNAKIKTIRESYERGVNARLEEGRAITRLCIYIQGPPNSGKTYAALAALDGIQILTVGGGGTGKFDRLRPDHDAIVIDDDVCPNLLNMTDNYICRAYKRNNNNPAWAGRYFIVTSNLSFADWLRKSGIDISDKRGNPSTHYTAMWSRFYICEIRYTDSVAHLALVSSSTRGSSTEQFERAKMFVEFAERFNTIIASYTPATDSENIVDLIATLDPFSEYWDNLEDELNALEAAKEPDWEKIEANIEYQARKELGEPVTLYGNILYFPTGYEVNDWCNPDRSQEEREQLRQKQLIALEKWRQKEEELQQQSEATATKEHMPKLGYIPTDRMY